MSNIAMQGGATGSGTVTLLAPSTSTNRTINLPDSNGTILTTATAGVPVNGPAFSAYRSSAQSLSSATWTKVQINVEEFNINSNYDSTTNYRFTPTVAGYYQVNAMVNIGVTNGTQIISNIYKNGTQFKKGSQLSGATYTNNTSSAASTVVYLNGSTDYIELYALAVGTSPTINGGSADTYFQSFLARSAV